MSVPLVSIIFPTLNRTAHFPVSIGSVLAQSFGDFELIVVDDGSSEDIEAAVSRFGDKRVRYIRRPTNGGPPAARNTGIAQARGRYIAFQDSDDEWMLDKLEQQMSVISDSGTDVMCIGSLVRRFGESVRFHRPAPDGQDGELSVSQIMREPLVHTQSWVVPREALEKVGGFDERLNIWDDWELLLRLMEIVEIYAAPLSLVYSARHDDSITNDSPAFIRALDIILEKHRELISNHSESWTKIHYMRAKRLMKLGRWERAKQDLKISLASDHNQWRAWAALAAITLKLRPLRNRIAGMGKTAGGDGGE